MLEINIPGFGLVRLEHLVSDFTGTLSVDGKLLPGVKERLNKIAEFMKIHVLTADTFGRARSELSDIKCEIHILTGDNHDVQKEYFVIELDTENVVSFGNGNNDRKMLKAARLGIAVTEGEGCAIDAITAADIHVRSAVDGLDLLLNPKRCKATLRF
jgi:soluble P-type ATPase